MRCCCLADVWHYMLRFDILVFYFTILKKVQEKVYSLDMCVCVSLFRQQFDAILLDGHVKRFTLARFHLQQ